METLTLQTEKKKHIYSVSEITRNIRFILEENFAHVWIEGEISNFKHHTSGHMYFSLKDETASMQCVMFRGDADKLQFECEEGLSVLCLGRVSVYSVRGQYQLYVERMEPKGLGALQLKFQQLKEKLEKEGLFDPAHKKTLPFFPERIALVTSIDGAALRDMLHVLDRRFPTVHVMIYPVQVQGAGAAETIAEAIADLNRWNSADVMIVGRGGGSLEDLWAFNEEVVARAIFESTIPVISAVGHEVDFTIADFVADFRAPTPSAAAEIVLPPKEDLRNRIEDLKKGLVQLLSHQIRHARQELTALQQSRALRNPLAIFETQFQRIDELKKNLMGNASVFLGRSRDRVYSLLGKLEALGPVGTLKRGFSVSMMLSTEKVITSVKQLKKGDRLKTKLSDGFFISEVKDIS